MQPVAFNPIAPRAHTVLRFARELGFALAGVAPAEPSEHGEFVRDWLAQGRHGEMHYLAQHLDQRLDPRQLLPGARSVICVADRYAAELPQESPTPASPSSTSHIPHPTSDIPPPHPTSDIPPPGRIARYAWGEDYHKVLKKRLHALEEALRVRWPEHEYRTCVDTAPVLEREHAQRAGLGWIGKHTLLIHPRIGSWFLLGEIVTTLPIQTAAELGAGPVTDHCGTCTRCIDACPTQCITPYQLDARRCVSYLTLEHRGSIDPSLHEAMGDWIAGCDVCQEVCPHNQPRPDRDAGADAADGAHPPHPAYAPRSGGPAPAIPLLEVLGWDAADRQRAFERSALKRIKLGQLKRNALIVAGNALARRADAALRARVEALADDPAESDLVRLTARQVLERLPRGHM